MTTEQFRAAPPFARMCMVLAHYVKNPAPPVGYKPCRTCEKPMLAHDRHARCQRCRNAGGYLGAKYARTCEQCGQAFVADKTTRRFCSAPCASKAQRRTA